MFTHVILLYLWASSSEEGLWAYICEFYRNWCSTLSCLAFKLWKLTIVSTVQIFNILTMLTCATQQHQSYMLLRSVILLNCLCFWRWIPLMLKCMLQAGSARWRTLNVELKGRLRYQYRNSLAARLPVKVLFSQMRRCLHSCYTILIELWTQNLTDAWYHHLFVCIRASWYHHKYKQRGLLVIQACASQSAN